MIPFQWNPPCCGSTKIAGWSNYQKMRSKSHALRDFFVFQDRSNWYFSLQKPGQASFSRKLPFQDFRVYFSDRPALQSAGGETPFIKAIRGVEHGTLLEWLKKNPLICFESSCYTMIAYSRRAFSSWKTSSKGWQISLRFRHEIWSLNEHAIGWLLHIMLLFRKAFRLYNWYTKATSSIHSVDITYRLAS